MLHGHLFLVVFYLNCEVRRHPISPIFEPTKVPSALEYIPRKKGNVLRPSITQRLKCRLRTRPVTFMSHWTCLLKLVTA